MNPDEILEFWFDDAPSSPAKLAERVGVWFSSDPSWDAEIATRYAALPDRALAGELDAWRDEPRAAVALTLVLDQFPRNLYRNDPRAFAYDPAALGLAKVFVDTGMDDQVAPIEATFAFLPFEHSEALVDQNRCVALYERLAARVDAPYVETFQGFVGYAKQHREVIERFGRFPHRNALLGRDPTPEEARYLERGGQTFGGEQLDESDTDSHTDSPRPEES